MGNKENVIELNGKRYDAKTGRQFASTNLKSVKPQTTSSIDGIVNASTKRVQPRNKVPAKQVHHKTHKSSTLVRRAVKKPSAPSSTTPSILRPVDTSRVKRASSVSQSKQIKHFNLNDISSSIKRAASLPIRAAPSLQKPINMPKLPGADTIANHVGRLQNSLEKSTAHELPKLKKAKAKHKVAKILGIKNKTLNTIIGVVLIVVIGGYFAYQKMPSVAIRLAAARAGIHATLPAYKPDGFSLSGPVAYNAGQVKISYKSNSDDRHYDVTQTASAWDSQSLLQNFINANRHKYQTFQDNGRTIYIYNGSDATWVDGGIWYQVLGNSALSSDQLIDVASSL